jgi:hypothetical protein
MTLQGFDPTARQLVPVKVVVSQPRKDVVRIECEVGASIMIYTGHDAIEALIADGDDMFRIKLAARNEGEVIKIMTISTEVTEVHYVAA